MDEGKEREEGWEGGERIRWMGRGWVEPVTIHQRISYLSTKDLRDDPPSVIKWWESENKEEDQHWLYWKLK